MNVFYIYIYIYIHIYIYIYIYIYLYIYTLEKERYMLLKEYSSYCIRKKTLMLQTLRQRSR